MTIAYVIDDLSYGGAQKQLSILARSLPSGYRPLVVSMSAHTEPFGTILRSAGVDVVSVTRGSSIEVRRLLSVRAAIRDGGADVVHGFLDAANAYAFLAARLLRRPVVLSLRNERLRLSGMRAVALRAMLRRAERVLVNSVAGRQLLTSDIGVSERKVLYVKNWIEPAHLELPSAGAPQGDTLVIGNVGRFAAQKRLHLLIEAFCLLQEQMPDTRLLLMGDGIERESLVRRAERLGLRESVEFVEPGVDVAATLARMHCFVLPSAFEGLPNSALEALAMGVPVVASRAGDIGDLIVEGKTGTLIDDDSPRGIAAAIERVLCDRLLIESARTEGPRLIAAGYSIDAALRQLLPVYDDLTK
jgi:glycosyltransferase involved in cell wall biosynthesis